VFVAENNLKMQFLKDTAKIISLTTSTSSKSSTPYLNDTIRFSVSSKVSLPGSSE
jgi:hypothetical protein